MSRQCHAITYKGAQCSRDGTGKYQGKWYCRQHIAAAMGKKIATTASRAASARFPTPPKVKPDAPRPPLIGHLCNPLPCAYPECAQRVYPGDKYCAKHKPIKLKDQDALLKLADTLVKERVLREMERGFYLSIHPALDIQTVYDHPEIEWDWESLSLNPAVATEKNVRAKPNAGWDFDNLSITATISIAFWKDHRRLFDTENIKANPYISTADINSLYSPEVIYTVGKITDSERTIVSRKFICNEYATTIDPEEFLNIHPLRLDRRDRNIAQQLSQNPKLKLKTVIYNQDVPWNYELVALTVPLKDILKWLPHLRTEEDVFSDLFLMHILNRFDVAKQGKFKMIYDRVSAFLPDLYISNPFITVDELKYIRKKIDEHNDAFGDQRYHLHVRAPCILDLYPALSKDPAFKKLPVPASILAARYAPGGTIAKQAAVRWQAKVSSRPKGGSGRPTLTPPQTRSPLATPPAPSVRRSRSSGGSAQSPADEQLPTCSYFDPLYKYKCQRMPIPGSTLCMEHQLAEARSSSGSSHSRSSTLCNYQAGMKPCTKRVAPNSKFCKTHHDILSKGAYWVGTPTRRASTPASRLSLPTEPSDWGDSPGSG